jgi:hypothetical protein
VKTTRAIALAGLLTIPSLFAHAQQPSRQSLTTIYENIIENSAKGQLSNLTEVAGHLDNLSGLSVAEIQSALPLMQEAMNSPHVEVRSCGLIGLYAIDERMDSAALIGYLVPDIAKNLQDPTTWALAYMTLSGMKPKPPEAAISLLLQALQSDEQLQAHPKLGAGVVFSLVQIDPNREDISAAIDAYMNSKMKTDSQRVDTLNALATRQVLDKRLIADISANLTQPTEEVRISAIRALTRSGAPGVEAARRKLEQMAGASEPSDRVRAAANQALETASETKNK